MKKIHYDALAAIATLHLLIWAVWFQPPAVWFMIPELYNLDISIFAILFPVLYLFSVARSIHSLHNRILLWMLHLPIIMAIAFQMGKTLQ